MSDDLKSLLTSLHGKVDSVQSDVGEIKIRQAAQAEQIKSVTALAGEAKDIALRGFADESDRRAIRAIRRRNENSLFVSDDREGKAALRYIYLVGGVLGLICTVVAAITGIIALTA